MSDLVAVFVQRMDQYADKLQTASNNMKKLAEVVKSEGLDLMAEDITGLAEAYQSAALTLRQHIKSRDIKQRPG